MPGARTKSMLLANGTGRTSAGGRVSGDTCQKQMVVPGGVQHCTTARNHLGSPFLRYVLRGQ